MLIIITELHVRNFWRFFEFASLSMRSLKQAKRTPGNKSALISNKGWKIGYTLTAWENKEAMMEFRNNGAHKKAMTRIRKLSTRYKTLEWESETLPSWSEARSGLSSIAFKVLK